MLEIDLKSKPWSVSSMKSTTNALIDDPQSHGSNHHPQRPQPLDGRVKGLVALAEAEPNV